MSHISMIAKEKEKDERLSLYKVACDLETSIMPYCYDRRTLIYNVIHIVFFYSLFKLITHPFEPLDGHFKVMFGGYSLIGWTLILWRVCLYTNEPYVYLRQRIINFYIVATTVINLFLYYRLWW
jgi:hypothetical protein